MRRLQPAVSVLGSRARWLGGLVSFRDAFFLLDVNFSYFLRRLLGGIFLIAPRVTRLSPFFQTLPRLKIRFMIARCTHALHVVHAITRAVKCSTQVLYGTYLVLGTTMYQVCVLLTICTYLDSFATFSEFVCHHKSVTTEEGLVVPGT